MSARVTLGERVAAVEEALAGFTKSSGVEFRDLKKEIDDLQDEVRKLRDAMQASQLAIAPLLASNARLAELIAEVDQAKGRDKLIGRLVGGGVLTAIGAAIYGIFDFFSKGGAS